MTKFVQMYQDDVFNLYWWKDPNLRWGQAICNQYNLVGEEWSELFYTHSNDRVVDIISEYFERYNIPYSKED